MKERSSALPDTMYGSVSMAFHSPVPDATADSIDRTRPAVIMTSLLP